MRQLVVASGLGLSLVVAGVGPASTALAAQRDTAPASRTGDAKPVAPRVFGTVTSYDATSGVLVVATAAGGTVTATITDETVVKLASAGKPKAPQPAKGKKAKKGKKASLASSTAETRGRGSDDSGTDDSGRDGKSKGSDDGSGGDVRAERRAKALAALVAGAQLRVVVLDPRTGDLRSVIVAPARTAAPAIPAPTTTPTPSATPDAA